MVVYSLGYRHCIRHIQGITFILNQRRVDTVDLYSLVTVISFLHIEQI